MGQSCIFMEESLRRKAAYYNAVQEFLYLDFLLNFTIDGMVTEPCLEQP